MPAGHYASLDEALDAIASCDITLRNGNSNHAPMVAEALCALGRPDAVMPWLARYRERTAPRPVPGEPIVPGAWREALGRCDRFADWAVFFDEALAEAPWVSVLELWVDRLAPGFGAAATHGPIRLGHAARALADRETPARLRELADALAGWAATYRELPAAAAAAEPKRPGQAIAEVPLLPAARRRPGNIVARLAGLEDFPAFAPAIGLLDVMGAGEPLLAELTETFARVFLANARDIATAIAFIHGVTSLAALGNLIPHLAEETARRALRYGWQAGCGLYACYAGRPEPVEIGPPEAANAEYAEELVDRAITNGDEHVIKFAEACRTRHARQPSPAYPAAVRHLFGIVRGR